MKDGEAFPRPWESSTRRRMAGGWADPRLLPRGPNGRALCRWCHLEVPARRRTFCSDWCVEQWRLRTDPSYLRQLVFLRDQGVCAACGLDTQAALNQLRRARGTRRSQLLDWWGLKPGLSPKSLWEADHIVPVSEGGGECDLSNLRTLCLRCHRQVTRQWRRQRKASGILPPGANLEHG
ncbi:MAG: HNH endonuclease [Bryobacteraceae bacterium]|nr:HNH endonuclease [Bryobacteraceae bacterium]MDW8378487.1 HNH endonuclease signature motif containing protein [Bryobacterales bacterium]